VAIEIISDSYKQAAFQEAIDQAATPLDTRVSICHQDQNAHDLTTYAFFSGVTLWLDTISSVTSGTTPVLLPFDPPNAGSSFRIQLENIMGSKNWAVLQIGRISALYEQQSKACQGDYSGCTSDRLHSSIESIREELVHGLTEGHISSLTISSDHSTSALYEPTNDITRIFALTGLVYLHLVILGVLDETTCVDTPYVEAMDMLRRVATANFITALVFPLYIIGCVAREEDKPFFRHIFSTAPLLDPTLDHRSKMLPQLEQVWTMRKNAPPVGMTWSEVLQVSNGTLLI
jgi:hypothetical protein